MPWSNRINEVFSGKMIPHLDSYVRKHRALDAFTPKLTPASPKAYYGIEVEIERTPTTSGVLEETTPEGRRIRLWHNVEDGSLRNQGREFVSCALSGEDVEYALTKLETFLRKNPRTKGFEFTDRTSVHVHVNAQGMSLDNLRNFLICYIAVEPVLYRFCGGKRHKNIFCVPLNQARSFIGTIQKFIRSPDKEVAIYLPSLLRSWKKYLGLNLLPLASQGTIEFRHMPGNIDIEKIHSWINLITNLLIYSCKTSFEDNKNILQDLNTNSRYSDFILSVFPESNLCYSGMEHHLEDMVKYLKLVLGESGIADYFTSLPSVADSPLLLRAKEKGDLREVVKRKVTSATATEAVDNFNMHLAELEARQVEAINAIRRRVLA